MISCEDSHRPEFTSVPLFKDETVPMVSKSHPVIEGPLLKYDAYNEQRAAVSFDHFASFNRPRYDVVDKQASIVRQGMTMMSVFNVVSQARLVATVPRRLTEEFTGFSESQVLPLPLKQNSGTRCLSWHETVGRDRGHQWMEE